MAATELQGSLDRLPLVVEGRAGQVARQYDGALAGSSASSLRRTPAQNRPSSAGSLASKVIASSRQLTLAKLGPQSPLRNGIPRRYRGAMPTGPLVPWLRDSDPALRWQVERDLAGEPPEVWEATGRRIATEGFGAQLLAAQDPDGQWAGGAYFPAGFDFEAPDPADEGGQPWTATTWALTTLREWGSDPAVLRERRTAELLEAGCRWEYDDLPYWGGEVDCCINAMTLANGLWLGADVRAIAAWFVEHRLPDGGWNCEWVEGSTRSSFHSTLNALKGLLAHETATGGTEATRAARRAGEEFLLERGLFRRLSTGEPSGIAGRRHPARPAHGRGGRPHPSGSPARRHLGAGTPAPRPRLVRGGRAGRRAFTVADPVRDAGARLVRVTRRGAGRALGQCGGGSFGPFGPFG